MRYRMIALLVSVFLVLMGIPSGVSASTVRVVINGYELVTTPAAMIVDDRTLVPLRAVSEGLGADVNWDGDTRTVTVLYDGDKVVLQIGSRQAFVNDRELPLDVPAQIFEDRTFVPLRFVAESLGATVSWDEANRTAYIASAAVTITFWHTYNPTSTENKTLMDVVIPAFERKYPYITVLAVNQPTDNLHDRLAESVAAGTNPELMRIDLTWTPEFANQGVLEPVDGRPGFADTAKSVIPGALATTLNKGLHYGLPLDLNTQVIIYRKDALARAGMTDAPKTMDEFAAFLAANKGGFAPGGNDEWGLAGGIFQALGGKITSPDYARATGFLNSDASVKALQQLAAWQKDGSFASTNLVAQPDTWYGLRTGKYGSIMDGTWFFAILGNDPAIQGRVVAAPVPAGPGGSIAPLGGEDIVMFANSRHKDADWKFMQFMLSDEVQNAFARTGQIPVTTTALQDDAVQSVPYFGPYLTQLQTAVVRTPHANFDRINKIVGDTFAAVLGGKADAMQALDQAARQIDSLLAQ